MTPDSKLKTILLQTIKKAGDSLIKDYQHFNQKQAWLKSQRDLVTKADLRSEKIIIDNLKKNFPHHQILSEEAGLSNKHEDYLWIIDPLDGTTNFYIHNPIWAVSIALIHKKKIIMGAIYCPIQREIFFAEQGKGAYLNDKKIKISTIGQKDINAYCHGNGINNIKKAIKYYQYQKINSFDCRQLGSAATELVYVAAGRIQSFLAPGTKSWDVAAGVLIVREAGGRVTNFQNKPWNITDPDILATNRKSHLKILKIIKKIKI